MQCLMCTCLTLHEHKYLCTRTGLGREWTVYGLVLEIQKHIIFYASVFLRWAARSVQKVTTVMAPSRTALSAPMVSRTQSPVRQATTALTAPTSPLSTPAPTEPSAPAQTSGLRQSASFAQGECTVTVKGCLPLLACVTAGISAFLVHQARPQLMEQQETCVRWERTAQQGLMLPHCVQLALTT